MYSDERRAELLERAYRRGTELRLRRRRWLATLTGVVVVAVAGGGAFAVARTTDDTRVSVGPSSSSTTASTTPDLATCAASIAVVPAAEVPSDVVAWAQGLPVVGGGALWAARPLIDLPPDHQGNVWRLKFSWFTRPFGLPTISGRRLDGPGTFHADANAATDARGTWVVSSLEFSAPGCWEVTGHYLSSTIRFRVHIAADVATGASTTAVPTGSTSTSGAAGSGWLDMHAVHWSDIAVPGSACLRAQDIQLHHGQAFIPDDVNGHPIRLGSKGPRYDMLALMIPVSYGDFERDGHDDAVVELDCNNNGATADGAILFSAAVYSGRGGKLVFLGLIEPRHQSAHELPTLLSSIGVAPGTITVREDWYGRHDMTCCPTGRARSTWKFAAGRVVPATTKVSATPR